MEFSKSNFVEQLTTDESFISWVYNTNNNHVAYWNLWIKNNPSKIDEIELAKAIVRGIPLKRTKLSDQKIEIELSKVLQKVGKPSAPRLESEFKPKKRIKPYYTYAALFLLALVVAIGGYWGSKFNNTVIYETNYGQILELKLSDGTSVVLNGNSKISFEKDNPRNITLDGEAYFKVQPIPSTKAKFWVNTKDLQVEVFGTQFQVSTRKKKTKVVLDEGSIHLNLKNGDNKKMIPGEIVSFSEDDEKVIHQKVANTTSYALWKDGTYTFNNSTLKEVMSNIEYTYGIKTEFKNKNLELLTLSGGIPNQNLSICIKAIERATGTTISKKDDILLIH